MSTTQNDTKEHRFNLFKFLADIPTREKFSVFRSGKPIDVNSFQGTMRWNGDGGMVISYWFQEEGNSYHDVCHGTMFLDWEENVLLCTVNDKYGDEFKPSADYMFMTFDEAEPSQLRWSPRESDSG